MSTLQPPGVDSSWQLKQSRSYGGSRVGALGTCGQPAAAESAAHTTDEQRAGSGAGYEEAKAALLLWERAFAAENGRPAGEHDRATNPDYMARLRTFKEVRRYRRMVVQGSEDKPADEMPVPEERRILVREYRKIKKRLAAWDMDFERLHGRPPTASDRTESKPLQELLNRRRKLK